MGSNFTYLSFALLANAKEPIDCTDAGTVIDWRLAFLVNAATVEVVVPPTFIDPTPFTPSGIVYEAPALATG